MMTPTPTPVITRMDESGDESTVQNEGTQGPKAVKGRPRAQALSSLNAIYEYDEYCENEMFNATCDPGEVILVTHARYGRMRTGRCVKLDYGHVGCQSDVREMADAKCSGRQRCEMPIPNNLFAQTKPCPDDLKPYLEAGYTCLKVHHVERSLCTVPGPLILSSTIGYLASHTTATTGCGGPQNPWVINAKPGQVISIKVLDFSVASRKQQSTPGFPHCTMYAVIRERLATGLRNITVCGGTVRERQVYASKGPSVEVIVMPVGGVLGGGGEGAGWPAARRGSAGQTTDEKPHFLLKYEVEGCPDVTPPPHTWSARSGDGLVVRCNYSNEVFHLKCMGSEWAGELGNCSKSPTLKHSKIEYDEIHIPYGMSIMIVIVIALVIGLFVLTVGLLFLKKQKGLCQQRPPPEEDIYGQHRDDDLGEKDYVSAPWQQQQQQGQNTPNTQPGKGGGISWSRESDYPGAFSAGTDLPPCTPLMDRFHKPPLYGQLGSKLPCGCPTYVTRSEVIQEASPNRRVRDSVSINPSNPDHVQYFIVEQPDMVPNGGPVHPAVVSSQGSVPRAAAPPKPGHTTSTFKPNQNGGNQQTDEIKLKMRMSDTSGGGGNNKLVNTGGNNKLGNSGGQSNKSPVKTAGAPMIHDSFKVMCKDRMENASNEHIECVSLRDTSKDTEL